MGLPKGLRSLSLIAAAVVVFAGKARGGSGSTVTNVTLSAFKVDSAYTGSITDAASGVVFSNPHSPASTVFIIDYWNALASMPDVTPGRVVSSNGYVGNGGVSLPYDFGFTMTFPSPASAVDMYAAFSSYGSDSAITMNALGSTGNLIGSTTLAAPLSGSFVDAPLNFSAGSNRISSVTIVPTDIPDAFGRISFTVTVPEPEPAGILCVALTAAGCTMRCRQRKESPVA